MRKLTLVSSLTCTSLLTVVLATSACIAVKRSEPYPREVIALKFASAENVKTKLCAVYSGTEVMVVADERSNSLIVVASKTTLAEVQKLVAKLDVEVK